MSEVREPSILQSKLITLPSSILIIIFEARNTYFEVCISYPFLDSYENTLYVFY